jgi:hypothetical protein
MPPANSRIESRKKSHSNVLIRGFAALVIDDSWGVSDLSDCMVNELDSTLSFGMVVIVI